MRRAIVVLLCAAAGACLPSQSVLVVGPGGFAQIRDAIQVAASGDVIEVLPGSYWNFVLDKGVTIRAALPGTVDVGFDAATPALGRTRFAPPPGQPVDVVGLRFLDSVTFFPILHRVEVTSGRVRFDECELLGQLGALQVSDAEVVLQSCRVEHTAGQALSRVIDVVDASVTMVDSEVVGATTASLVLGSSPAIELFDGTLHASHSVVRGSSVGALVATAAIGGLSTSSVWVSDSTLASGGNGAGCALLIPVSLVRTTLSGVGCTTNALAAPHAIGVTRPQPPTRGAVFSVAFTTAPNGFVGVFASTDTGANGVPLTEQPGMLATGALFVAGLVLTDQNGDGGIGWPIPNVPALRDVGLWLQGVGGTSLALPLQASPVVGGLVR